MKMAMRCAGPMSSSSISSMRTTLPSAGQTYPSSQIRRSGSRKKYQKKRNKKNGMKLTLSSHGARASGVIPIAAKRMARPRDVVSQEALPCATRNNKWSTDARLKGTGPNGGPLSRTSAPAAGRGRAGLAGGTVQSCARRPSRHIAHHVTASAPRAIPLRAMGDPRAAISRPIQATMIAAIRAKITRFTGPGLVAPAAAAPSSRCAQSGRRDRANPALLLGS